MAEESPTGGERTETATAKRREDFRNKGQVAQSKEVQTATLFTIGLLFWLFYMPAFWHGLIELLTGIFQALASFEATPAAILVLAWFITERAFFLILPLFLVMLVTGLLASYLQIGWLFTAQPLIPDLKKLNPISGMSRFFSRRSLVELVKSLAKASLVAYIAYSTVFDKFDEALLLIDTAPSAAAIFLGKTAALVLAKICGVLIFIAFLDLLFVRWEMEEKMKMTKQEVKEEYKEMEGDPRIKAQIRSIQQEMARKRMMAEVPTADVVVTNPTHLAVALRYASDEMDAPLVVAKGADHIALKIRELAREHGVPVVENPPVARLLHKIDLGDTIPDELFRAVAEILAHVYALKGKTR